MSLFHDERGSLSMARTLLVADMVVGVGMIAIDIFTTLAVPSEGYILIGGMWPLLAVWAGGSRMAQHLSPVARSAVTAITGALAKSAQKYGGHTAGYNRPADTVLDNDIDFEDDEQ